MTKVQFRAPLDENDPVVKFMIKQQVLPHCTPTHMTDSMTLIHAPRASFPSNHLCFSGILTTWCDSQRSISPWSAWRREASAARRSRRRLVCRGRPRSGGCRGCARMATWRRATSGGHVARRLVCIVFSLSMLQRLRETKRLWGVSRKTPISRRFSGHCSLCSIPRFKRSFLFCSVLSLPGRFFSLFWLFGVVCHASSRTFLGCAPCSCCCSHVHG